MKYRDGVSKDNDKYALPVLWQALLLAHALRLAEPAGAIGANASASVGGRDGIVARARAAGHLPFTADRLRHFSFASQHTLR